MINRKELSKNMMVFVEEMDKPFLKFMWKIKITINRIAKTTLKMKNNIGGLIHPNFKIYYIVIKSN